MLLRMITQFSYAIRKKPLLCNRKKLFWTRNPSWGHFEFILRQFWVFDLCVRVNFNKFIQNRTFEWLAWPQNVWGTIVTFYEIVSSPLSYCMHNIQSDSRFPCLELKYLIMTPIIYPIEAQTRITTGILNEVLFTETRVASKGNDYCAVWCEAILWLI